MFDCFNNNWILLLSFSIFIIIIYKIYYLCSSDNDKYLIEREISMPEEILSNNLLINKINSRYFF